MRNECASSLLILFCLGGTSAPAQEAAAQQIESGVTTLTVQSTLVLAPVLVKDRHGKVLLQLTAHDFMLSDNGVPQKVSVVQDTDAQPLALAIVVQTGGAGARRLGNYRELAGVLDALIGGVEHRVELIGFDSAPHVLKPFTPNTDEVSRELENLRGGDEGGAILDAVVFAVEQLRPQPVRFRRAILLVSETIDHGSKAKLGTALRLVSDTNTAMYSFGFSSTRSAVAHEASQFGTFKQGAGGNMVGFSNDEPGPPHGCFSREGAAAEYDGHYSKQVLDCISQLAPPLRLATMAFIMARNALRTNASEAVARLTGGEFFHFHDAEDLKKGMISASNDVPNYYVLSFRPTPLTAGIHALKVEIRDRPDVVVRSRAEYWVEGDGQ